MDNAPVTMAEKKKTLKPAIYIYVCVCVSYNFNLPLFQHPMFNYTELYWIRR